MRQGVRYIGQNVVDEFTDPSLVHGIGDRPQQAYGNRLHAFIAQALQDVSHAHLVERFEHAAFGVDAFGNLESQATGHVGLGVVDIQLMRAQFAALAVDEDVGEARRQ